MRFNLKSKFSKKISVSLITASLLTNAFPIVQAQTQTESSTNSEQAKEKKSEPTFNIWEYEVHNVKTLPPETIESALSPYLGPDKTFSDVQEAAHAIERLYSDSGYPVIVVEIPEQDVQNGVVKLDVVEGIIASVKVTDSRYFLLSDIKNRVTAAKVDQPLYVPKLQEELNKLNSLSSDLRVIPLIKQGEEPGTVAVDLKVKDKLPLHGDISYDNYASANTSPTRLSASIGYDNLWSAFHSFNLQMQTTPEKTDEIKVISGTYVLPLEDSRSRLAIYGVVSDSKISAVTTTNDLLIKGNSKIAGFRYVKPQATPDGFQQVLTLGVDYKSVQEQINYTNDKAQQGLFTPMTYAVWAGEYKLTWRKESHTTQMGAGVYFGIRNLFNEDAEFENKRFGGEPNFIYWKGNLQETIQLPADFSVTSKLKFQATSNPLISNEQLALGGKSTVRGYYESQTMGDRGAIATIELAAPEFLKKQKYLSDINFYWFADVGWATVVNPLPDQINHSQLASSGLGLEFNSFKDFNAELTLARILRDACSSQCGKSASDVKNGDVNANFTLTYKY